MDAIVLAGGIPQPGEPLYPITQGRPKAMIPMGGEPMIGRVINALRHAKQIDHIIVVGLDDPADREALQPFPVDAFLDNQGSLVANGMAGLRWLAHHRPETEVIVGCSSDIPHLRGHMVDHLLELCHPFDRLLYYPAITRALLEQRYPAANRTYAVFKGGVQLAGADIFVMQTAFLNTDHTLWEELTQARKSPWQLARVVGWATLFKLIFKRLSVDEAAAVGGRILGSDRPLGVVLPPFPELAMDADKPHQVKILQEKWGEEE